MKIALPIVAGTLFAASAVFAQGAGAPAAPGTTGATSATEGTGAPSGGPGGQGVIQPGGATAPSNRGPMAADPTNTPGWSMMSAEERSAHMQRMNQRGADPSGGASAGGDPGGHLPRS